jgi:hypothetical protein
MKQAAPMFSPAELNRLAQHYEALGARLSNPLDGEVRG